MKKTMLTFALAIASFMGVEAQSLKTPAASPLQTIKQEFALGTIELSYSRPSVKGRTIMGGVVPYGKVWRTGANGATTISFSDDVKFGGQEVKAGKYGLLTIPEEKKWTVILTKDLNVTSPADYRQENDVLRVDLPNTKGPMFVETFSIVIADMTATTCQLVFRWADAMVRVPITAEVDSRVMKQIDNLMDNDNRPYFGAAAYYYDNGKDLNKAKMWVDKAVDNNPQAFWVTLLKARIYQKLGDKSGARAAAEKTIELATKAENDDYVKMATELIKGL